MIHNDVLCFLIVPIIQCKPHNPTFPTYPTRSYLIWPHLTHPDLTRPDLTWQMFNNVMFPLFAILVIVLTISMLRIHNVEALPAPQTPSFSNPSSVEGSQLPHPRSGSQSTTKQHPLFKSAHEAIKGKNCFGDYNGEFTMTHKVVSSCFAGGFVEEVHVHPCSPCESNAKPAAKVIYACEKSNPRVKCL